ncbi:MAG: MBOAT family protein, partial [Acidimicrobiia bacterium]|nr:MBOAT family protein [Acidimicrobiia bacterium]
MLFPTFTFALFFVVVLTVGWFMPGRRAWWKLFMLAASYFFYAYWDARFVGLIAASTVLNQTAAVWLARLQHPGARRAVVSLAVGANLASLGFFKYAGFFVDSAESALEGLGIAADLPLLNIILPVGISFFTFQAISYVLDVYRGDSEPAKPLDFAVYLAFFPQLVAGPIVRAHELIPQLNEPRTLRHNDFMRATVLIAAGLFKKMVVATYLAEALVDDVFAFPERFSSLEVLLGVYGYAIQIYADFSGYTDIAIGVALLLGIRLPDNFNQPYRAASIQDFWRRWHMSLSRWLRDYLYIPLGGNRGGEWRRDRNLLLTMLLGGLWHGAAWTFVLWGALHGLGLLVERRLGLRLPGIVARLVTFHFVCFGWILFRAESLGAAGSVLARLFSAWTVEPTQLTWVAVALIVAALATQFWSRAATGPTLRAARDQN